MLFISLFIFTTYILIVLINQYLNGISLLLPDRPTLIKEEEKKENNNDDDAVQPPTPYVGIFLRKSLVRHYLRASSSSSQNINDENSVEDDYVKNDSYLILPS